ncbi:MAG: UDP-glucose 4-epimerase [Parcubacteria group bacterium GW2011_GWA2_43_13]|nr:MAG: UDP-glucose 4-epimerase [Parcubacteria group bacterium GW2011_GWA2_43_13]OGY71517.1 MAG: hypothetical protein A2986_00710 [Candidatus Jacksonbacteria bacterium RIFCSPLOWO2_01_FULL_44_13]HAZ16412.1 UDP-glucose 4-epimerase [Candidatus Jacksonbacteria bacterium]
MKTVLITGGAGLIGSHIADRCMAQGYRVVVLDNLSHGTKENLPQGSVFYHGDIRDESALCEIREKESPLVVIHCAAQISVPQSIKDPDETFAINSNAVERIISILKPLNIIFSSSGGAVYGNPDILPTPEHHPLAPLSPYGESKRRAEEILKMYHERYPHTAVTILRYANVYGERQPSHGGGVIAILCKKLLDDEAFTLNGDGTQTRDFVYVSDVVSAVCLSLDRERGVWCYNIGSDRELSLRQAVASLESIAQKTLKITQGDAVDEVRRSVLDISTARMWGWIPVVSFEEGLKRTWEWWNNAPSP